MQLYTDSNAIDYILSGIPLSHAQYQNMLTNTERHFMMSDIHGMGRLFLITLQFTMKPFRSNVLILMSTRMNVYNET